MPTITSYRRSANARMAGSILTGVPGSTSRKHDAQRGFPAIGAVGPLSRFRALHAVPRRGVERSIVFAADVEHDARVGDRRIADGVGLRTACRQHERETRRDHGHVDRYSWLCLRGSSCSSWIFVLQHLVNDQRHRRYRLVANADSGSPAAAAPRAAATHHDTGSAGSDRRASPRRPPSPAIMIPTDGSITSSTLSRPPPRTTDARPISSASRPVTNPPMRGCDDVLFRRASASARNRRSPADRRPVAR